MIKSTKNFLIIYLQYLVFIASIHVGLREHLLELDSFGPFNVREVFW